MADIRFLLTNDFFGAFARKVTSWGALPGGDALKAEVSRLRGEAASSVWLDVGDFAGGGPLSPATEHELSWAAAGELGFDAAVPGNHEFDYGDAPVLAWANKVGFPLIAADKPLVAMGTTFKPYHVFESATGRTVAIIGINFAERRGRTVWDRAGDLGAAAELVIESAAALRGSVDHIIAAIHDGVPEAENGIVGGTRMHGFCTAVRGHVDAVLGAHTLMRHVGEIAGVPYIQPWALGTEIGILDIGDDGTITLHCSMVPTTSPTGPNDHGWSGTGAGVIAELSAQTVGHLPEPLAEPAVNGFGSFADAVTAGMLAVTGADVALTTTIEVGCGQVPLDGIKTYIPAGPVTEADVIRALPWPGGTRGDELWMAELTADEVEALTSLGLDVAIPTGKPSYRALRKDLRPYGLTVLSSNYVRNIHRAFSRDVTWTPTSVGLRDAFRAYLNGSANQLQKWQ